MTFDPVWLAISRAFQPILSLQVAQPALPVDATVLKATIEKELAWVRMNVLEAGAPEVSTVQRFERTAPAPGEPGGDGPGPGERHVGAFRLVLIFHDRTGSWYTNPQTEAFCEMLGLTNKVNPIPPEFRQKAPAQ